MWKPVLLILGLALSMIVNASAQGVGLGPQLGYQRGRDADNGNLMVGAALRMKLGPGLGVEGSLGYREQSYSNGAVTVRDWPVMLTGLIYPFPMIYGAMGAGWYNTSFDYDQSRFLPGTVSNETKQNVGWHFGGGLELPTGATSKLTADIRYVFLNYNFTAVPGSSGVNSDFYVLTVGYLFDL
jgi:opacity protein-like surface antigen